MILPGMVAGGEWCPEPPPPPSQGSWPPRHRGPRASRALQQGGASAGLSAEDVLAKPEEGQADAVQTMLLCFKVLPCSRTAAGGARGGTPEHDHRSCAYHHGERDRRRRVLDSDGQTLYSAVPCPHRFDDRRVCPAGEDCTMCHSTSELLYHPEFFRKRLCHQARRCPRGRNCAFAHSRQELLMPAFTDAEETNPTEEFIAYKFKTQWCPIGGPHDWENCVYAHTCRDLRRSPEIGYSSWPCRRWAESVANGSPEVSYTDRCPLGVACPHAHGAKEQLYHPLFYKTGPCSDPSCKRGVFCAFTHGDREARAKTPLERPAASSAAAPLPNAEAELLRHQPSFWRPPQYHTYNGFEDQSGARAAASRGRPGGGRGAPRQAPHKGQPADGASGSRSRRQRGRAEQDGWQAVPGDLQCRLQPPGSWDRYRPQEALAELASAAAPWGEVQLFAPSMGYCNVPGATDAGAAACGLGWHLAGVPPSPPGSPWGALPQLQFDPSFQMLHYGGFAAPAQGFDTSWPEDLGLTLPPERPKVRRSTKEQGLRTPSSVGTPVYSDTGSSAAQTAGESADAATEVPSLGASGATAVVAGSRDSGETSSAKSEPEEPAARAARGPGGPEAPLGLGDGAAAPAS